MPSDIKCIRRDQKQRRNGEACRAVIENNILVPLDIKFIRPDLELCVQFIYFSKGNELPPVWERTANSACQL